LPKIFYQHLDLVCIDGRVLTFIGLP